MSAPRKFDWDEARRLRRQGWTYTAIAEKFGVSHQAIRFACDTRARNRMAQITAAHQQSGTCVDCGTRCSRNDTHLRRGISNGRCRECAAQHRTTSVRDDALQCNTCHQWLWDTAFPHNVSNQHRRGRHSQCTTCGSKAKREYRRRNRERENAYQREYKRRRRQQAA